MCNLLKLMIPICIFFLTYINLTFAQDKFGIMDVKVDLYETKILSEAQDSLAKAKQTVKEEKEVKGPKEAKEGTRLGKKRRSMASESLKIIEDPLTQKELDELLKEY